MKAVSSDSIGTAWRRMCGIALLWASLAALVHVATSDGATYSIVVGLLGFLAFVLGLTWFSESVKRDLVDRLRSRQTSH